MSERRVLSFDDYQTVDGKQYAEIEAYGAGNIVSLGSLNSSDMLEWLESNEDKAKQKEAGLRLLVKSLVDPATKLHLPAEKHDEFLALFRLKDARENGKVIQAILALNGIGPKAKATDPNASSEAASGASPSASLLPSDART